MTNVSMNWKRFCIAVLGAGMVLSLAGCKKEQIEETETTISELVLVEETLSPTQADETVMALTPDGPILPSVDGVEAEYSEPIPDYLRIGMQHPVVIQLQEKLMRLGFMDTDEPTDLYGEVTVNAVKYTRDRISWLRTEWWDRIP